MSKDERIRQLTARVVEQNATITRLMGQISRMVERAVNPPIMLDSNAHAAFERGERHGADKAHDEYSHLLGRIYWRRAARVVSDQDLAESDGVEC